MNMFRILEYIVFFLLGYKVLKVLFAENKPKQRVQSSTPNQHINFNDNQQAKTTSTSNKSKFNDAEFIDYEEVK